MEAEKIRQLLLKYTTGEVGPAEVREIENLIERGQLQLEDIEGFGKLNDQIAKIETPEPSLTLDHHFHEMLEREKKSSREFDWRSFFAWKELVPRLAFASLTLLIGLAIGFIIWSPEKKDEQIVQLGQEISDLKEMMMLSLLEKESVTDRLKAVNLTQGMDQASRKVTAALLQTLNSDENVNVRLAALDALRPYSKDSQIREALIRSIARQKSPLVQVALAELMAELQEKGAINAFKRILEDQETPSDIKKKIQESIQVI